MCFFYFLYYEKVHHTKCLQNHIPNTHSKVNVQTLQILQTLQTLQTPPSSRDALTFVTGCCYKPERV